MASDKNEKQDESDAEASEGTGTTINDPLTRRDVEAPRAKFEGRTPE